MDKQKFIEALGTLLADTVQDAHHPDRIPKVRDKRERRCVGILAEGAGVELTEKEVEELVGF